MSANLKGIMIHLCCEPPLRAVQLWQHPLLSVQRRLTFYKTNINFHNSLFRNLLYKFKIEINTKATDILIYFQYFKHFRCLILVLWGYGYVYVAWPDSNFYVTKLQPNVTSFLKRTLLLLLLLTAIGLSPGGSGYFTCKQNMKLFTTKFKSGGLHEKHVVATWNVGNHLSICF